VDDPRNISLVTRGSIQSGLTGEIESLKKVLDQNANARKIKIRINSKRLATLLTSRLQKLEDKDWLGVRPKNQLKGLLVRIRQKQVLLSFQPIDAASGKDGLESAKGLARAAPGLSTGRDEEPATYPKSALAVHGGRLSQMTQSLLYKAIVLMKKVKPRRPTTIHLDMTCHGVKSVNGNFPTDEAIWQFLRNRVFPPRISRDCHGFGKPAGNCPGLVWGTGTGWVYPTPYPYPSNGLAG
jgi:hypothetical protein